MRSVLNVLLFAILPSAFLCSASAAASNGGAAVCIQPSGYRFPAGIVTEPDSGALVPFLDTRGNAYSLYAQRLDRHGRPMWAPGGVLIRSDPGTQWAYYAIPDGAGGCILVWQENRGASGLDIVAQRVLANGALGYAATGLVVCNAAGSQGQPQLVTGPSGSYYVLWKDERGALGNSCDIYAQRLTMAGSPAWAANGVRVNSATYVEYAVVGGGGLPAVASDLQGGLLVSWDPYSSSVPRAQRLNSSGALLWGADGVAFGASGDYTPSTTGDGSGGAYVAYTHVYTAPNGEPYLQHILAAGTLGFAGLGITLNMGLSTGQYNSFVATPVRNASGGCFVYGIGWSNSPYGASVVRQEVNSSGTLLRGYGENLGYPIISMNLTDLGNGVALEMTPNVTYTGRSKLQVQRYAYDGTAVFPGAGVIASRDEPNLALYLGPSAMLASGVLMVAFADDRYATPQDQSRFAEFGQAFSAAGNPLWDDAEQPTIVSVRDAPQDQGGYVRVNWNAGAADLPGAGAVTEHLVWRTVPGALAAQLARVRPASSEGVFQQGGRTLLAHTNLFWEMVGSEPAAQLPSYALTVPTGQDSIAGSPADESFMVEARDDSSHIWWSGVLSGHSVDNLAPPAPSPAAGYYSAGHTSLYWGSVAVSDLCCYEIFRGANSGFTPSPANLVGTTTDVTFNDTSAPAWYRIAARDIHGNLGPSALVLPGGVLDAGPSVAPHAWRLNAAWRPGEGGVALALDVPRADQGRVELFDVEGRRLWSAPFRTLAAQSLKMVVGPREAPLLSSMVFARMRAASGQTLTARALILR